MPMEPRVHIAKRSDLYSGQKRGTAVGLDVYVACQHQWPKLIDPSCVQVRALPYINIK